jgi:hypothetical protein
VIRYKAKEWISGWDVFTASDDVDTGATFADAEKRLGLK